MAPQPDIAWTDYPAVGDHPAGPQHPAIIELVDAADCQPQNKECQPDSHKVAGEPAEASGPLSAVPENSLRVLEFGFGDLAPCVSLSEDVEGVRTRAGIYPPAGGRL